MSVIKNFWKNDAGFIWLLGFTLIFIVMAQFSGGTSTWLELLLVRLSLFFFTIIVISASVLSPRNKRIGYTVAGALVLLAILMTVYENQILVFVQGTLMAFYMLIILVLLIGQIFEGEKMTLQKIGGGVAAYVLIGHVWASLYLTIFVVNNSAFQYAGGTINPEEALRQLSYFSFVTLTTIGYGDITASAPLTKILVILEGLLGQLFPAIFIAKLVSHQIEDARK